MDWANERYVRLYTRDTPEWLCMCWQARALWPHLIRKADRSGVIANRLGVRGVAVLVSLPIEVVEPGIADLLQDGCLQDHQLGYVIPNYIEAQESPTSDAMRQRESRERRRVVTNRDTESQNVTKCHEPSHAVTDGHTASQPVTPSLPIRSDPSLADPDPPIAPQGGHVDSSVSRSSRGKRSRSRVDATAAELASVRVILDRLSDAADVAYRGCEAHHRLIIGRLRDGITEHELRAVVAYCAEEWDGKPEMRKYLRPETLFGPQTIARYIDAARARFAKELSDLAKRDAESSTQPKLEVVK